MRRPFLRLKTGAALRLAAAAAVLLASCAGCGGLLPASTEFKSEPERTQLTLWKWVPTPSQMVEIEREFERQHPDIDLVVKHIGNADAYRQKLAVGLAGGKGPDILAVQVGASANRFKPFLEPLASYAMREWGAEWRSLFSKLALDQSRFSGDGFVVLPGGLTVTPLIYYDQQRFQDAGVKPPATYEELKEAVKRLRTAFPDLTPGIGIGGKNGWALRDVFLSIAGQLAPGQLEAAQAGETAWTDEALVDSFRWLKKMFDDGVFIENSLDYSLVPDLSEKFLGNELAMLSSGSWGLSGMTREAAGTYNPHRVGVFPLPALEPGREANVAATVDVAWAMNRDSAHKDAAWAFIAFMTMGTGQQIWADTLQVLPAARHVEVDSGAMYGPLEQDALRLTQTMLAGQVAGARELEDDDVQERLYRVLQALVAGSLAPEEAAARMEDQEGLKEGKGS
ncbi:N-Acetyl-D-glucosamine ABC transport system, sugar-binding protein [Paenibacillus pasadenensis]|uniref:N-Acetyl-D-glucosamine ABC transport system, sugar-binding protein n=1 Tax=Paenibacillus pasadenensis TaxID=217090 RepID=A0A2N5N809_9BACL|nr:ABC transporter substrate-binding protein [Paenibacillus pasadenensis]PLT46465.1 N-Acetyl-D-glucosamine ABC transport system, sugar-binding protein [Paenibacillus pasadenensis]